MQLKAPDARKKHSLINSTLINAVNKKAVKKVEAALNSGANANIIDENGFTLLHQTDSLPIAEALLEHNAIHIPYTVLSYKEDKYIPSPFRTAIERNHIHIAKLIYAYVKIVKQENLSAEDQHLFVNLGQTFLQITEEALKIIQNNSKFQDLSYRKIFANITRLIEIDLDLNNSLNILSSEIPGLFNHYAKEYLEHNSNSKNLLTSLSTLRGIEEKRRNNQLINKEEIKHCFKNI